ncbi:MAG: hypothetical protein HOP29_02155, partial [Phycisphaerales bacterium]|nr:hypothetical protein [Phycisphaerales bacterium]
VGERTVYRRMGEPGFRGRVNAAKAAIVEHAAGRMAGSMTAAADTLRGLLSAEREATRLGAARSILELGPRLREAAELERRITDLETTAAQRIEQLEDRLREGGEFGRREGREVGRHEGGSWPRG